MRVKPIGFGGIAALDAGEVMPGLQCSGALSWGCGIGFGVLGKRWIGDERRHGGVYQKRHSSKGIYYIKEKDYAPTNPRTVKQQANRAKFADAVAAWNVLTKEQQYVYNHRANKRGSIGRRLFMHEYLRGIL